MFSRSSRFWWPTAVCPASASDRDSLPKHRDHEPLAMPWPHSVFEYSAEHGGEPADLRTQHRRAREARLGTMSCAWCWKWQPKKHQAWCFYCDTGPYCLGDCAKDHAKSERCYFRGRSKALPRDSVHEDGVTVDEGRGAPIRPRDCDWPAAADAGVADDHEVSGRVVPTNEAWYCSSLQCDIATRRPNYTNRYICRKCGAPRPVPSPP